MRTCRPIFRVHFRCTTKSVRRRRAVLAVLVAPLADPAHRLLRRVRSAAACTRPARRAGGARAAPGGRQPRAQAGPRPVRLVRRHVRRQGRARQAQEGARRSCAARSPTLQADDARERAAARACVGINTGGRPAGATARSSARVIARSPTRLVLDDRDQQGLERRRAASTSPVVNGDGLVGKVTTVSDGTAVVTLITDHRVGVSAQVVPTRGEPGIVKPAVGAPGDLLLEFVPNAASSSPRARRSSPPARSRRARSRSSRAASRSARVKRVDQARASSTSAIHVAPVRRPAPARHRPGAHHSRTPT